MRANLVDNVADVHTHLQRAKARVAANGGSQRALHIPKPHVSQNDTLWQRILRLFPTPEDLIVAGREVKGFIVPHWAAGVILAAMLSIGWAVYNQISSQRDMLIEIKTELRIYKEHDAEFKRKQIENHELQDLKIQDLKDKILVTNAKRGN